MKKLNTYINEAWSGIKQHTNIENIKSWCDDMGIKNYTINSKGEIDVDGSVDLTYRDFKELPYKFGVVLYDFELKLNDNLISLKNCPDCVHGFFTCRGCTSLDSLEGCPKEVGKLFWCSGCKREFTKEDVQSLCKVKGDISINITNVINNTPPQLR